MNNQIVPSQQKTGFFSSFNKPTEPPQQKTGFFSSSQETYSEGSSNNLLMYIGFGILIIIVLGLIGLVIYFAVQYQKEKDNSTKVVITTPPPPKIINPVEERVNTVPSNTLLGVLISENNPTSPLFFPLYGRMISQINSDKWYYYTIIDSVITPIISTDSECGSTAGCKQLYDNSLITLTKYPTIKFKVRFYKSLTLDATTSQNQLTDIGYLKSEQSGLVPVMLPLVGRKFTHRDNRWQYFIRVNDVKIPLFYKDRNCEEEVGCEPLTNGAAITLDGYGNRVFTVVLQQMPATPADKAEIHSDAFVYILFPILFSKPEACTTSELDSIKTTRPSILVAFSKITSCNEFRTYTQSQINKWKDDINKTTFSDAAVKTTLLNDNAKLMSFINTFIDTICVSDKVDTAKLDSFLTRFYDILCSEKNKVDTTKYPITNALNNFLINLKNNKGTNPITAVGYVQ